MNFVKYKLLFFVMSLIGLNVFSQSVKGKGLIDSDIIELSWTEPKEASGISVLNFQQCVHNFHEGKLPTYTRIMPGIQQNANLKVFQSGPLSDKELAVIGQYIDEVPSEFILQSYVSRSGDKMYTQTKICPIRKSVNGFEKILKFSIQFSENKLENYSATKSLPSFASSSVLSSGDWYKIGIQAKGIYKLDRNFLIGLGIDVGNIDPRNIAIYGNGGKILPEKNSEFRYDDLVENSIFVEGEGDGVFDNNDYILFYGNSTEQWQFNPSSSNLRYQYKKNFYSDQTFYYITIKNTTGKRITYESQISATETNFSNSFDDYAFHELDASNLIKSGREKYGESFDAVSSYSFTLPFPNMVSGDTTRLLVSIAGRNTSTNSNFFVNYGTDSFNIICPITGPSYLDDIAKENSGFVKFVSQGGNGLNVRVRKSTTSGTGWLNYIRAHTRRSLIVSGQQLFFRDSRSIAPGNLTRFQLSGYSQGLIWDITNPFAISQKFLTVSGSSAEFKSYTDSLREFVFFTGATFLTPKRIGKINNQNLHGSAVADYILISHPTFLSQAREIAELHEQYDSLSYLLTTPDEIYNEFSSGNPDPVAIRDFVRMLYERGSGTGNIPKYLLLFGDGSYDNKSTDNTSNTNFILTYQNASSLSFISSITSDDFYGLLDQNEGDFTSGDLVDIGIGRWPVKNISEADVAVKKLKHYYGINNSDRSSNFGEWRNWLCFVADDADLGWETTFVNGSENYSNIAAIQDSTFNIDKIYCDAFVQQSTPGGERYPEVNDAIDERVARGALILNFSGHGGELGWAHESILDVNQILAWKNINKLHMMLTATCEFSRFDDPARTSAGEYVLLNPEGGAIGLFTTTRIAYASDADVLCPRFFQAALTKINGKYPRMGDIIRITKINSGAGYRHFTLLGDPAIVLAHPKEKIQTESINFNPIGLNDTIKALQKVTIKGFLSDANGNKMSNFNGIVYSTVFDKKVLTQTLGNDLTSTGIIPYRLQKNVLYRGKASVTNGDFQFTFIVPKDINYSYGFGKISYYADNGQVDANGHYSKLVVGGSDTLDHPDVIGPEVRLFMNNDKFVRGGITNENPRIYAEVFDSTGINTVGNGIGHDVSAVLDELSSRPIILNDYYDTDINSYQSGKVNYQLEDLSEGTHKLTFKVWDVVNNSSTEETEFVVAKSAELALKHVLNYPNPFTSRTQFFVEHNQPDQNVNLEIQIFTVSGKVVKSINRDISSNGFRTEGIDWDGKDEFGDKIGRGVYIYKVKLRTAEGKTAQMFEKLVILN